MVRVSVDRERREIFVIYQNIIRIYSSSGMETFSFGDDLDLGHILDAAVDRKGTSSCFRTRTPVDRDAVHLSGRAGWNHRDIEAPCRRWRSTPTGWSCKNGLFYFASLAASSVIITDAVALSRSTLKCCPPMEGEAKEKDGAETIGFTVGNEGSLYFTVPAMFKVCRIFAGREVAAFGRPGSAAGRFGVVAGVALDSRGNLLVADKLKCVVMVFDKDFRFLYEFGYRGNQARKPHRPERLGHRFGEDRVYVTQGRRRGVGVFALNGS